MRHGDMVKADKITDKMPLTKAAQSSRRQRKLSTATATPGKRAAPPDIGHNAASGEAASAKKLQKEGAARMHGCGGATTTTEAARRGRGCLRVRAITGRLRTSGMDAGGRRMLWRVGEDVGG